MSGIHKYTKLMEAESAAFNENKLIQTWVDQEIRYPYTPQDLGNKVQTDNRTNWFYRGHCGRVSKKRMHTCSVGQTYKTDKK